MSIETLSFIFTIIALVVVLAIVLVARNFKRLQDNIDGLEYLVYDLIQNVKFKDREKEKAQ